MSRRNLRLHLQDMLQSCEDIADIPSLVPVLRRMLKDVEH